MLRSWMRQFAFYTVCACVASSATAQFSYRAEGESGFMQDLNPNDGVDYQTAFTGTWSAAFSVPAASGLTLVSNIQNQGGSLTTYSGATVSSVILNTPTGPLNIVSAPTPANVRLWDRASFAGGTDYFEIVVPLGSTTVTISVLAAQSGPPADLAYDRLFVRGTPSPNTLIATQIPLAFDLSEVQANYRTAQLSISGNTPVMPGAGRYNGDITRLFGGVVAPPPLGSCCAASGQCSVTIFSSCTGTWTASGICDPNPCVQPVGACCDLLGDCTFVTEIVCNDNGGNFSGPNSVCTPNPCVPVTYTMSVQVVGSGTVSSAPAGISCGVDCTFEFAANTEITLTATPAPGWVFDGFVSDVCEGNGACVFFADADYTFVATFRCPADFNEAGGLTVQDIFAFLGAWFAGSGAADFDGVGGLTVQDIFAFLAAWFAGC